MERTAMPAATLVGGKSSIGCLQHRPMATMQPGLQLVPCSRTGLEGRWCRPLLPVHPAHHARRYAAPPASLACSSGMRPLGQQRSGFWQPAATPTPSRHSAVAAGAHSPALPFDAGSSDSDAEQPHGAGHGHGSPLLHHKHGKRKRGLGRLLVSAVSRQLRRFSSLTGRFFPMVGLFALLSFVNTLLDSLKDTLVITAVGGGAQVIPYLSVYAVLPSSLLFLFAYSSASQHLSRAALFNSIIGVFCAFFLAFAFVLLPNHATLHPDLAVLSQLLPPGLEGLVGMARNWTFTWFFCMAELWGDVCLGLLFWGLANDTTSLSDARTLYPLFGLGANVAQAMGGFALKSFGGGSCDSAAFATQVQGVMLAVVVCAGAAVALHAHIDGEERAKRERFLQRQQQREQGRLQRLRMMQGQGQGQGLDGAQLGWQGQPPSARDGTATAGSTSSADQSGQVDTGADKERMSLRQIFRELAASVPIQCLAVMSLAQGLCTNLMEFAWKSHIRLLYHNPADFTAFLGEVAAWQGIVTGALMIISPALFTHLGWRGVAGATPKILLWGGVAFFAACLLYQYQHLVLGAGGAAAGALTAMGGSSAMLGWLVYGGAALYVFSKSAKFSLFKPATEMVYISLDEQGRTKGKAAIDVAASSGGKAGGSILQQLLLLLSGGAIAGSLPVMFIVFLLMSNGWLRSVHALSDFNPLYGRPESVHPTLTHSDTAEDDGEGEEEEGGGGAMRGERGGLGESRGVDSGSESGSGNGDAGMRTGSDGPLAATAVATSSAGSSAVEAGARAGVQAGSHHHHDPGMNGHVGHLHQGQGAVGEGSETGSGGGSGAGSRAGSGGGGRAGSGAGKGEGSGAASQSGGGALMGVDGQRPAALPSPPADGQPHSS